MDGTLNGFLNDAKGGNFADWRDDGKITFFLHPKCYFGKRTQARIPGTRKDDDGKIIPWSRRRFHHGDEDILARILAWLKNADDIDASDVVLRVKAGKIVEEYRKGDLLGLDGFDWRKKPLNPRTEYLLAIVRAKKPKTGEILTLPFTAGRKISKLIDAEIAELGEDEGNPLETPWAIQVSFDEKASGSDMYSVRRSNLKLTEEVEAFFAKEPEDVKQYTESSNEDLTEGTTAELLAKICVVPCPLLEVDREQESAEDDAGESDEPVETTKPKADTKPKSTRKTTVKPKRLAKPTPTTKQVKQIKSKTPVDDGVSDGVEVQDCQAGVSYDHEGEDLVYSGNKDGRKRKAFFFDGDDCKVSLKFGTVVKPVTASEAAEDDETPAAGDTDGEQSLTVQDLGPDDKKLWFYDGTGVHLQYIRYNDAREKGVFTDDDDERVFLAADALLSRDGSDEVGAELEPRTTEKETPETEEPEATEGDDDGGEVFGCPCGATVKETDPKCPKCGAIFEDEDEGGETPFDED